MKTTHISKTIARRMALNAQLFGNNHDLPSGKEGVAQTIEKLGYVQIDTIAVVRRAHHHTLWNRRSDYNPEMLHELQASDRRIFEYWGHAASYLPMSDYRFFLPKMRKYQNPRGSWERARLEKHGHLMKPVLERIRQEGPLGSKDFEPPPGTKAGGWWDWKPAKVALEMLFSRGELMVTERRNFQKVYDLTERVLPAGVDTRPPDNDELGRFLVRRALSAHGVAKEKEIREHIQAADGRIISNSLAELADAGEVVAVETEGDNGSEYYALSKAIETSTQLEPTPRAAFLLSPFDNLVIQRERTLGLFGFEYTLECYVPAAKRKYGYFALPILWGEDLVGRLDPKADRKNKTLIVRNLHFEPGFGAFDAFLPAFADTLGRFVLFNHCERVTLESVSPGDIQTSLECHLREAGLR